MQLMAYENQKKSPPLALVLEFFLFPGVGQIYADHVEGALITWAGIGGGLALVIVGVSQYQSDWDSSTGTTSSHNNDSAGVLIVGGALVMVAARIYGLVDSWQAASNYNAALAKRIGVPAWSGVVAPIKTDHGLAWGPALQLRF